MSVPASIIVQFRHNTCMKIAIIGTGIAGLGAAYLLAKQHSITVFEKNNYLGGHARTIEVPTGQTKTAVDTGFIVFNDWNYPNLMGLFQSLNVPFQKSDMSFGVSIDNAWLEYGSSGLFAQKRNLFRPAYWGMLRDILRFNKRALAYTKRYPDVTLEVCLDGLQLGQWFRNYYLLAMGASIWSCPLTTILKFPAQTFLQFFNNHGLLNLIRRPQWYTVTGGSRVYVERLTQRFREQIKLNCAVTQVSTDANQIGVTDATGYTEHFDHVIFACHADEALKMLTNPTPEISNILSCFSYQQNHIIVHSDLSFMPQRKKCWASWVYLSENQMDQRSVVSLSYWMNNLQNLDPSWPILVTLNPERRPQAQTIYDEHSFSHPVFDLATIKAQDKIATLQGQKGLWFCGAYQRYGFHEDGLLSAVNVAKALGAAIPWA